MWSQSALTMSDNNDECSRTLHPGAAMTAMNVVNAALIGITKEDREPPTENEDGRNHDTLGHGSAAAVAGAAADAFVITCKMKPTPSGDDKPSPSISSEGETSERRMILPSSSAKRSPRMTMTPGNGMSWTERRKFSDSPIPGTRRTGRTSGGGRGPTPQLTETVTKIQGIGEIVQEATGERREKEEEKAKTEEKEGKDGYPLEQGTGPGE